MRLRNVVGGTPDTYMDLTGYTGKAQMRELAASAVVAAEFTVTILDQIATPGGLTISLSATQTSALEVKSHVWDLQLTEPAGAGGKVRTWLKGDVTVIAEVTRL